MRICRINNLILSFLFNTLLTQEQKVTLLFLYSFHTYMRHCMLSVLKTFCNKYFQHIWIIMWKQKLNKIFLLGKNFNSSTTLSICFVSNYKVFYFTLLGHLQLSPSYCQFFSLSNGGLMVFYNLKVLWIAHTSSTTHHSSTINTVMFLSSAKIL